LGFTPCLTCPAGPIFLKKSTPPRETIKEIKEKKKKKRNKRKEKKEKK
jgi:hypothetical protein